MSFNLFKTPSLASPNVKSGMPGIERLCPGIEAHEHGKIAPSIGVSLNTTTPSPPLCGNVPTPKKSSLEHLTVSHSSPRNLRSPMFKTPGRTMSYRYGSPRLKTPTNHNQEPYRFQTPLTRPTPNPFDAHLMDRLHHPTFSPSVFASTSTPSGDETPNRPFQWSIDQQAILYPADINEMPHQQDTFSCHDEDTEARLQEAIETFFSSRVIAPSPWTDENSSKPSRVITQHEASIHEVAVPISSVNKSSKARTSTDLGKQDVACQTALSLPVDLDLQKILGEYYTQQQGSEESSPDVLSTSTLRRKLFCQGDTEPASPHEQEKEAADPAHLDNESPKVSPLKCVTPEPASYDRTPKSAHFSSSPIIISRLPCRSPVSGRTSIGGEHLTSPELSPIITRSRHCSPDGAGVRLLRLPSTPSTMPYEGTPSSGRHTIPMDSPLMSPITNSLDISPHPLNGIEERGQHRAADPSPDTFIGEPQPANQNHDPLSMRGVEEEEEKENIPILSMISTLQKQDQLQDEQQSMDVDSSRLSDSEDQDCFRGNSDSSRPFCLSTIKEQSVDMESLNHEYGLTINTTNQDTGYQTNSLQLTNQDTGYQTNSLQLTNHDGALHSNLTGPMSSFPCLSYDTGNDSKDECFQSSERIKATARKEVFCGFYQKDTVTTTTTTSITSAANGFKVQDPFSSSSSSSLKIGNTGGTNKSIPVYEKFFQTSHLIGSKTGGSKNKHDSLFSWQPLNASTPHKSPGFESLS